MELLDYVDSIKDQLTGFGVLESELSDDAYKRIVNTAVKELNRYYNDTEVIEVPGESCIDLNKYPTISNVINVIFNQFLVISMVFYICGIISYLGYYLIIKSV